MESQPQNPEFRINPGNFHPCRHTRQWEILVLLAYAHKSRHSLNMHTQLASGASDLNFGLSLYLLPYFM